MADNTSLNPDPLPVVVDPTAPIVVTPSGPVEIDDSTPVDVAVPAGVAIDGAVTIDDSTPVAVAVPAGVTIPAGVAVTGVAGLVDVSGSIVSLDEPAVQFDGFGHRRVVQPKALLDWVGTFGLDTDIWGTQFSGAGAVADVLAQSAFRLTVGASGADESHARTHERYRYQAGRSKDQHITGYCDVKNGDASRIYRWGFGDDNDGAYFEAQAGVLYIVKWNGTGVGAAVTRVAQADWNVNKMPGLDWSKLHIWEPRVAWLGAGTIGYFVDGVLVHVFDHARDDIASGDPDGGAAAAPFMRTASLPVSIDVENTGACSGGGAFTVVCVSVASDGGDELHGKSFTAINAAGVAIDTSPLERSIFALRIGSAFNTVVNHGITAIPKLISASAEGGRASVRLYWNPTLVGTPAWTAVSSGKSVMEAWFNSASEPDILTFTGGDLIFRASLGGDVNGSIPSLPLDAIFSRLGRKLRRKAYGAASEIIPNQFDILLATMVRVSTSPTGTVAVTWEESR